VRNNSESAEELHEVFAWALLAVIVMHLARLAWHTIRHRENISLAMVTGKKAGKPDDAIGSAHAVWGVVLMLAAALWIAALFAGFNASRASVKLPGIGVTLQLGESELCEGKQGLRRDDD
jgi:hypothetical protein